MSKSLPVLLLDLDGVLNPWMDPLPVVTFPPVPFPPERKAPAVAAVAGERPAAWIDDNQTDAGRRWAAERAVPTLLVSVDPAVGWTRADVDRVVAWAGALTGPGDG
jgi:hypothetical protein